MKKMRIAVALFAKLPVPGRVKTRLVPSLGVDGAAQLYEAMLRDTIERLAPFDTELWLDRPTEISSHPLPVAVQKGRDLGERMHHAFETLLQRADAAIIVGSDAPTLPRRAIEAAIDLLERGQSVLGPATDGGYYLVGADHPPRFEGVRWSTRYALQDTERTLCAQHIEPWYDVDRPADLRLLRAHLSLEPGAAPHTAKALRTLRVFTRARSGATMRSHEGEARQARP